MKWFMLIDVNYEKTYTENLEDILPGLKYMINIKLNGKIWTSWRRLLVHQYPLTGFHWPFRALHEPFVEIVSQHNLKKLEPLRGVFTDDFVIRFFRMVIWRRRINLCVNYILLEDSFWLSRRIGMQKLIWKKKMKL